MEFVDDNIEPDASDGPKEEKNPFADGNYPGAVAIYQQRLVFARSNSQPQTIWASQPGALNNFSTSYPLKDDDSIEATMDSRQANEIRHMLLMKSALVILTGGAEWLMQPGRNSDAIAPASCQFNYQSAYGSSEVPPLVAGNNILILQNSGKLVRDFYYTVTEEYTGTEVSILAENLLCRPILDWCYQNEPYHTVYAVRDDGVLLTLTYLRDQEVYAWSEHRTLGNFISVASIRNGERDDVYFIVERFGRFFVEYQKMRSYGDDRKEAFYVDCGATYRGEETTTISGLSHLKGQTVAVLADGGVVYEKTVADDGTIALERPAKIVHVGLPYETLIETLDPEISANDGTLCGMKKSVSKVIIRVRETAGLLVGPDEDSLVEVKFPVGGKYNEPFPLLTGDLQTTLPGRWRTEASVVMKQTYPLPMTVLSINSFVNVGE